MIDDDTVRLNYKPGYTKVVDLQFFCDLDDRIDTSLYDWWLSDIDFFLDHEEFKKWQEVIEDSMTWDLIEFWETWHNVDYNGTIKELSAKEKFLYNEEKNKLLIEHKKKRVAIKAEAVEIGL